MPKRKANIRPELIGELFLKPGEENIYRLTRCGTEPLAFMRKITGDGQGLEKPISEFANFVQLKPVRPIEKPKKPRADSRTVTSQDAGIKYAIMTALEPFGGEIPDELTEQERATIQGILDAGE